jgi:hypothetical protein
MPGDSQKSREAHSQNGQSLAAAASSPPQPDSLLWIAICAVPSQRRVEATALANPFPLAA